MAILGLPAVLAMGAGCAGEPGDEALEVHEGRIATRAGAMDIRYQVVDGQAMFQGDIVVPWNEFLGDGARSATVRQGSTWPNGVVPYVIDGDLPDPGRVTEAINHWNLNTAVHLVPRSNESDYIRFSKGNNQCNSPVGKQGGAQTISLMDGCGPSAIIHELGHAVGLYHEQSRTDRDSYIKIHYENIDPAYKHNFDKYSVGVNVGPYDYNSTMQYAYWMFSINGQPTITKLDGSIFTGGDGLSDGDKIGVSYLYGPPNPVGHAAMAGRDGNIDTFVLGSDHAIWHVKEGGPGGWGGWSSLGGNVRSNPAVGKMLDGRLWMFAVGWDNQVYHQWQDFNGNWSGWYNLGGQIAGTPVVGRNLDGRLELFARGTDGAIWHAWQTVPNGGWSGWASFGGAFYGNPAVALDKSGRLEVFARGADNHLWYVDQIAPNSGWYGWSSLGGSWGSSPAVGRDLDGALEVFVIGYGDNQLYRRVRDANRNWGNYEALSVNLIGTPVVGTNLDGRLEVIGVDPGTSLGHIWQTSPGGGFSGWATYGGTTSTRWPDVALNKDGRLEVFTAGVGDRALYHAWQNAPNSGWSGWAPFNGLSVIPE
jgi:hypothetical protein